MFSSLYTFLQNATWYEILDYVAVAVVARYVPSVTPYFNAIRTWLSKLIAK